jgi:hypothetical protein
MTDEIQAYPLAWPFGRPRSRGTRQSLFKTGHERAVQFVLHEILLLGGRSAIISTNIPLRNDGLPYANHRKPDDRAVAVYFTYKQKQMCFACDKWDQVHDNVYAVGKTIEALRGIERWGTGDMVEQAFTGFTVLPSPKSPHEILGVRTGATPEEIEAAYREKAKLAHSSVGGGDTQLTELNVARDKLREQAA